MTGSLPRAPDLGAPSRRCRAGGPVPAHSALPASKMAAAGGGGEEAGRPRPPAPP